MMINTSDRIAILGLSDDPSRYSNKAMTLLRSKGFNNLIGTHPTLNIVDGVQVVPTIADIKSTVHTVTVYVNPKRFLPLISELAALKPKRVILNPGTEDSSVTSTLAATLPDTEIIEACTLVLLQTNQF